MSSHEARIEALNDAIESLNEDAEGMHGLISRSIAGLDDATDASNRAAENAARLIEALAPLSETISAQHRDTSAMLEEARKATEEQRAAISVQIESLEASVDETLESVRSETHAVCSDLKTAAEESFGDLRKAQDETFEEFTAKSLKEQERTRDELQTDILGFKNATSARLDNLEAEVAKTTAAVKELGDRLAKNMEMTKGKLIVPIYIAIGIGVANLVCLLMLLMR